jgi:hypothetical protein
MKQKKLKIVLDIVGNRSKLRGDGGTPLSPKNEGPPTLSSEALSCEKITKKCQERLQIAKNAKSCLKLPKIGPNGLFKRFLGVFPPYKAKKAQNMPFYISLTNMSSFPSLKMGTPPFPLGFPKIPYPLSLPKVADPPLTPLLRTMVLDIVFR